MCDRIRTLQNYTDVGLFKFLKEWYDYELRRLWSPNFSTDTETNRIKIENGCNYLSSLSHYQF